MTSKRLTLIAAAGFLALGLTACGGSSGSVTIGSDGVSAQDGSGASVSVGADGATVSDGNGNSAVAGAGGATVSGADGSSVSAGADGSASVGSGGGSRQGTFGTRGQVTLAGALDWAGSASGTCDVNGDQRTVTAKGGAYSVVVDTNGADQLTLTVSSGGDSWTADFNGDGSSVVTMTPGRTLVSGAKLAGGNGTVDLDASFDC
jgi:hypothetical protein